MLFWVCAFVLLLLSCCFEFVPFFWVLCDFTGLLDWFEVDIISRHASSFRVICVFSIFIMSYALLPIVHFLDALHCLPREVEVPLKSALILVSLESPCEIRATHPVVLGERLLIITEAVSVMIEPMIGVFKEASITHSSRVNTIIYPKCSSNFSHLTFCPASGLRGSDVISTNAPCYSLANRDSIKKKHG